MLIYGAYGYTGSLIVDAAIDRGHDPIVAGRDGDRTKALGRRYGLETRVFSLEDAHDHLTDVDVVVHAAGPFETTARPMVEACLGTDTHYVDITGELGVFQDLASLDPVATRRGCALLPGAGFDVVPSDCLARWLADQCENPTELTLGLHGVGIGEDASISRGTALTLIANLGSPTIRRRYGRLESVPMGRETRTIDFGDGPRTAMAIPMGDPVTAYHSTGIETITVYAPVPPRVLPILRATGRLNPVLGSTPVRRLLSEIVGRLLTGPDEDELATARATVWGEVRGDESVVRGILETPNPYAMTAETAVLAASAVAAGSVDPGFQTPATAFGPDFPLEVAGVERRQLDQGA